MLDVFPPSTEYRNHSSAPSKSPTPLSRQPRLCMAPVLPMVAARRYHIVASRASPLSASSSPRLDMA